MLWCIGQLNNDDQPEGSLPKHTAKDRGAIHGSLPLHLLLHLGLADPLNLAWEEDEEGGDGSSTGFICDPPDSSPTLLLLTY